MTGSTVSEAAISRRARRFVAAGAAFLVVWSVATVLGAGRSVGVELGLYGFVLHTVFGKAYSLVPSYFDRDLAWPLAPAVHLPLSAGGAALLALWGFDPGLGWAGTVGSVAWGAGTLVFVATLVWTVRDNLTGAETATGESKSERRTLDRTANAFVPVALAYLLVGAYERVAIHTAVPALLDAYGPQVSHLLAAGGATVVLFAVGFRLLPRFTVARPPRYLAALVLPAGAVGPALIAAGLLDGTLLAAGAAVETVAVAGFAVAVLTLLVESDRDRVGFYGVGLGAVAGLAGVALGVAFVLYGRQAGWIAAHYRLNVLGFLGLTIVGVAYQFYPPSVGGFPGSDDRTALFSMAAIGAGLACEAGGAIAGVPLGVTGGRGLALVGTVLYAALLGGVFYRRYDRKRG